MQIVSHEAYQKTNKIQVDLERQQHRLKQYSRREYLDITGLLSSINKKNLEKLVLRFFHEIKSPRARS